jgi:hypothetical protein
MHRIYGSDAFAIVVDEGTDASYGLRGFQGVTVPRSTKQVVIRLSTSEKLVVNHWHLRGVASDYHERAWTFQEYLLSNWKLIFLNGRVEWRCNGGTREEDQVKQQQLVSLNTISKDWFGSVIPTLESLEQVVQVYARRKMSFPEDGFAAFAGVQTMLERLYQPHFTYGLPEFWFDIALNWTPMQCPPSQEFFKRRHTSGLKDSIMVSHHLPSWSWVGWIGSIQFPGDSQLSLNDPEEYRSWKDHRETYSGFTEPVTTWYAIATTDSLERRPIHSALHDYKLLADRSALPRGWRCSCDNPGIYHHGPIVEDTVTGVEPYHFQPLGHTYGHTYRYPFPLAGTSSSDSITTLPQTAYLYAQTSRTFAYGKMIPHHTIYEFPFDHPIWVMTSNGQYFGYLVLNNAEEERLFEESEILLPRPDSIELVATCKGYSKMIYAAGMNWDDLLEERRYDANKAVDSGSKIYDVGEQKACYFVLGIEWVDGVAYRRACGAVAAELWEQEREEELVDLILG